MPRFAYLDRDGKPRRTVIAPENPGGGALPVRYPEVNETQRTHRIRRNPVRKWVADGGEVVVTYDITARSLKQEKDRKRRRAYGTRRRVLRAGFTAPEVHAEARFPADSETASYLDGALEEAKASGDSIDWQLMTPLKDGRRFIDLSTEDLEVIRQHMRKHVQAAFTRQREIEDAIAKAADLDELAQVSTGTGWPGQE